MNADDGVVVFKVLSRKEFQVSIFQVSEIVHYCPAGGLVWPLGLVAGLAVKTIGISDILSSTS